jgi:hypothetical protein
MTTPKMTPLDYLKLSALILIVIRLATLPPL